MLKKKPGNNNNIINNQISCAFLFSVAPMGGGGGVRATCSMDKPSALLDSSKTSSIISAVRSEIDGFHYSSSEVSRELKPQLLPLHLKT